MEYQLSDQQVLDYARISPEFGLMTETDIILRKNNIETYYRVDLEPNKIQVNRYNYLETISRDSEIPLENYLTLRTYYQILIRNVPHELANSLFKARFQEQIKNLIKPRTTANAIIIRTLLLVNVVMEGYDFPIESGKYDSKSEDPFTYSILYSQIELLRGLMLQAYPTA